jgi:ATP-dependent RNA helicase DHX37/DHR1
LPTTLNLLSSSTLGTGRVSTHQRRLEHLEDKEVKRALDGRVGKRKRLEAQAVIPDDEESDQSEAMELDEQVMHVRIQPPHWNVGEGEPLDELHVSGPSVTYVASPPVGSALQRYPDGRLVQPSIKERDKGTKVSIPHYTTSD